MVSVDITSYSLQLQAGQRVVLARTLLNGLFTATKIEGYLIPLLDGRSNRHGRRGAWPSFNLSPVLNEQRKETRWISHFHATN